MAAPGIHIACHRGSAPAIRIDRPVHAARIFAGKTPALALGLIPALFSICGLAQASAGSQALKAALGQRHAEAVTRAHGALVRFETAREHLFRILMDWPGFTQRQSGTRALVAMQALMPRSRAALFEGDPFSLEPVVQRDSGGIDTLLEEFDQLLATDVFGVAADDWLGLSSIAALRDCTRAASGAVPALLRLLEDAGWEDACSAAPRKLPRLRAADLERELGNGTADRFVEAPCWGGQACETSPLTRQSNHPLLQAVQAEFGIGLLARTVAVVNELAATTRDVRNILAGHEETGIHAEAVTPGTGIAQVEAARGLLVHRAVLADDLIEDYRVVAPTEWNFHPAGSVSRSLAALTVDSKQDAETQAALLVTLMDPCVAWSLEVH